MGLPPLDLNGLTNLSVVRSKLSEGTIDVLVVIVVAVVVAVVLFVDVGGSAVVKMVVDLVVVDVFVVVVVVVELPRRHPRPGHGARSPRPHQPLSHHSLCEH